MLNKNDILDKLRELKPIRSEEYAVKEIGRKVDLVTKNALKEQIRDILLTNSKRIIRQ